MADAGLIHKDGTLWPSWAALLSLVLAHAAFILLLNPTGPTTRSSDEDWLFSLATGVLVTQPMLFSAWMILGPPPAVWRVPITLAGYVLVCLASGIRTWNLFSDFNTPNAVDLNFMIANAIFFVAIAVLAFAVRKAVGWRIVHNKNVSPYLVTNQFSMKYPIVLTTICAVLLAVGRSLATEDTHTQIFEILTPIAAILIAVFPVMLIPVLVMWKRITIYTVISFTFACAALTGLGLQFSTALIMRWGAPWMTGPELRQQTVCMQLGAAIGAGISSLMLRLAGYRLINRWSKRGMPLEKNITTIDASL
jgi:hypothetical protein